ncbi:MAG: hypothetical protein IPK32_21780 [Verrucomicrobiaceae bacterium]|nr:hypothetical protein [Verrucomicrobiaceae bacterium]
MSRDTISRIEGGENFPGVHELARLTWGVETTITDIFSAIERRSQRSTLRAATRTSLGIPLA